jgi:DNA-binding NarL/FixJ family response regulator
MWRRGIAKHVLSNKEIASALWLSERTVERHITSLYRKIRVERRSEATAFALRHSFVAPDAYDG